MLTGGKYFEKEQMDENKTALTESLIIWVSFCCLALCECLARIQGNHGSVFSYLFIGGGGGGVSENTLHQLRENEANMNESRWYSVSLTTSVVGYINVINGD